MEITEQDRRLIAAAMELQQQRTDGFRSNVAAAAIADTGEIITAMNIYHNTGSICAELAVLALAASKGIEPLRTIVAVSQRGVLSPCGRCRQVFSDYQPDIMMIVNEGEGQVSKVAVSELLPFAYRQPSE
jgi:cytidine deaminase